MPNTPRAVLVIDVLDSGESRRVVITIPTVIEWLEPRERPPRGVEDKLLVEMRRALDKLGVALDDEAAVTVERVDEYIAWCKVDVTL